MFKIFLKIISNFCYFIRSLTYHRDKRVILFGSWSGERFADNTRFLFQYLCANKEKLGLTHVVWVTRDEGIINLLRSMGYEAYLIGSKESDIYHKKAGMHILCNSCKDSKDFNHDIDIKWSYGAVRINLWHGVGVVKGVGQDSLYYKRRKKQRPYLCFLKGFLEKCKLYRFLGESRGGWGDDFFLSPTPYTSLQFSRFDYIPQNKFIQALYPRVCNCEKLTEEEKGVLQLMKKYKCVILHLPTFRGNDVEDSCMELSSAIIELLNDYNVLWIQKPHDAIKADYNKSNLNNHILNLNYKFDINTIMPYINILVTDYSSAASDARFFRKRILFYLPDLEDYRSGEYGFTPEAEELLYGPKFYNAMEFSRGLRKVLQDNPDYLDAEYERIRRKYWGQSMDMGDIWEKICAGTKYNIKK